MATFENYRKSNCAFGVASPVPNERLSTLSIILVPERKL